MLYGLICSAIVAGGSWVMITAFRKPKPAKTKGLKQVKFEEALIDFTPKKGYLPIFEKNQRLS